MIQRALRFLGHPLRGFGHRGAVLFWVGVTWTSVGVGVLVGARAPWPTLHIGPPDVLGFYDHVANWSWVLWLVAGLFAFVASVTRRWWDRMDWLGFTVAIVPPALTFALWVGKMARILLGFSPAHDAHLGAAIISTLSWLATTGVIATVASWPEVPTTSGARRMGRRHRSPG